MLILRALFAIAALAFLTVTASAAEWALPPPGYAYKPVAPCLDDPVRAVKPLRPGAAVYRLCEDQMAYLAQSIAQARRDGKLLLVTVGATWCPWCAALQRQIGGTEFFARKGDRIDYAATFQHIEIGVSTLHKGRNVVIPSGDAVVQRLIGQVPGAKFDAIPYIFIIDPAQPDRIYAHDTKDISNDATGQQNMDGFRRIVAEGHDFLKGARKAELR